MDRHYTDIDEVKRALHTSRLTIVTSTRRSGKTSLLLKAYEDM